MKLILGDLHFGQEQSLFVNSHASSISNACRELTETLLKTILAHDIKEVILNGDIKHATTSFNHQEKKELIYFFDNIIGNGIDLTLIRGNHDLMIDYLLPTDPGKFEITDYYEIDDAIILHGHELFDHKSQGLFILSHEHPAYLFRGYNKARIKLPAFVLIQSPTKDVIILPAANDISSGTNFPPRSSRKFLSPLLKHISNTSTMTIFPFDPDLGIFLLPPFNNWGV
jgi:putative SbcD/Mre11-related phosphoesterase